MMIEASEAVEPGFVNFSTKLHPESGVFTAIDTIFVNPVDMDKVLDGDPEVMKPIHEAYGKFVYAVGEASF